MPYALRFAAMPNVQMPPNEVIREFGRRHKAMKRTLLLAVAAWGAAIASIPAVSIRVAPGWLPYLLTAVATVLLVPFYAAERRYCCPVCGAKPVDREGDETIKPPPTCPDCRARLTE